MGWENLLGYMLCLLTQYKTVCYYHHIITVIITYKFQSESTIYSLPECQGTPCLKQAPHQKFK